jgi:hypothetical protein
LYSSSGIIRTIKPRIMSWAGHGGEKNCMFDFCGKAGRKERDH